MSLVRIIDNGRSRDENENRPLLAIGCFVLGVHVRLGAGT